MMNFRNLAAVGVAAVVLSGPVHANVVLSDSFAPDATGNWMFFADLADDRWLTQNIVNSTAGTIDSYSIWVSPAFDVDNALNLQLLGGTGSNAPGVNDVLATASFTRADILAGQSTISGHKDWVAHEIVWDLSGLNISAEVGDQFAVRHFSELAGDFLIPISGNAAQQSGGLAPDGIHFLRATGSSATNFGIGNPANSLGFEFFVNDGITDPIDPSPIPLPAGFPLLLAGLGGLAILRRKRQHG